ncbi:MAG: DUF5320 domain-containing protein [Deltaproteobacteria bacterium]|jgi:hypothetical protein|nr:DUF5320 domain-containing protein [Deltaproteobacteria bacterium]
MIIIRGSIHAASPKDEIGFRVSDADSEMDMLKAGAAGMQRSLEAISKRLDELSEKRTEGS